MITRDVQIRVRYKETDAMGVVHHSNYVNYCEVARTEMLREFGTTYKAMEQTGVMMPVMEVEMKFFTPAHYDDLLTVKIRIEELPRARMTFHHDIYNQHGDLVNTCRITLAFISTQTRRARRAPKEFVELLAAHFE